MSTDEKPAPKKRRPKITRHIADPPQHTRICSWLYDMDQARNTGDQDLMIHTLQEMPEPAAFAATLADLHDLYLDFLDSPYTYNVKQGINMAIALVRMDVSRRRAAEIVSSDPDVTLKPKALERRMKDNHGAYVIERVAATKTDDGLRFDEALKTKAAFCLYHYGTEKELEKFTGMTRADFEERFARYSSSDLTVQTVSD